MIKILIIEDELIIAEDMCNMLKDIGYEVVGNAMDANEALALLALTSPDLILLDINLGGKKDGIMLAAEINEKYQIPFIFTTSHTDAATVERAKAVRPVNYLVKPFRSEQLYTAIEMAIINLASKPDDAYKENQTEEGLIIKDALFIKDKYKYSKLLLSDILWIKADGNYLEIHLEDKKVLIRSSISSFLARLEGSNFFRTHKSYIVNLNYLTAFQPTSVTILKTEIPLSRPNGDELIKRLNII